MTALDSGRITIAAGAFGIAEAALEVAVRHAKTREQFGKPIGEFQGISFMLADMAVQLDAARLLVKPCRMAQGQRQAVLHRSRDGQAFRHRHGDESHNGCRSDLGGSGYTQEFPVERYMREAKVMQIVEGTNQVQRMIIGRALTQP